MRDNVRPYDSAASVEDLRAEMYRLHRRVRIMTGGVAFLLAVGVLFVSSGFGEASRPMPGGEAPAIEASKITLVDKEGRKRMQLGISDDGLAYIKLADVNAAPHLVLGVAAGPDASAFVSLFDDSQVRLASLCSEEKSGLVALRGRIPSVEVFDSDGKTRVALGLKQMEGQGLPEAELGIASASGQNYIAARLVADAPKLFLVDGKRQSEIRLGIEKEYDGYLTFSKGKAARVFLGIDPDIKQPALQYFPSDGGKPRMVLSLSADKEQPGMFAGDTPIILPK